MKTPSETNENFKSKSQNQEFPDVPNCDSLTETLLKSLKNSSFLEPLENFYLSRNGSNFSDLGISFTTEQVTPSHRVSIVSDDGTEVNVHQFNFEYKTQKRLKYLSIQVKFCKFCRSNGFFIEKKVIQNLGLIQKLSYLFHSLRCCSDPIVMGKFLVKKLFCIYCGKSDE